MPDPKIESALTDRFQTTVPDAVRRALNLKKRDRIVYRVLDDNTVVMRRKSAAVRRDPVVDRFLAFLAHDMSEHPERMRAIDTVLVKRIRALTSKTAFDLNAPLSPDDE